MQFITNGPDIPERLLQAHEEGRVVFFCGAGISYPAGLPDFKGLVDRIYKDLGTTREPLEEQVFIKEQYDATLGLLEHRYPGRRVAVRTSLAKVLKPKLRQNGAIATHEALLQLSTDRHDKVRLVTTNFDRIFHYICERRTPTIPCFSAPLLPIPKPSRWHGIVHLHGLLTKTYDETSLNRLVLTSGDFGLAYLTERWASRFVSDLFRNYTVCFVGYSINDPVLRYMMDALAVEEMLGEIRPEAFAFGGFTDGGYDECLREWEAKRVTPLLYKVPTGTQDHSAFHLTLKEWSDTYRDGVRGKELIVAQHTVTPPLATSRLDFAVGRVLWALTDGLATKHFADLDPVPPLSWLEPLSEAQFKHEDLPRFGVTPAKPIPDDEKKLAFSVIRRPSPYFNAPWMSLIDSGFSVGRWDDVMLNLARWLTRHLNDPKLVLWLANRGGRLHDNFVRLIHSRIAELDQMKLDGKQFELDNILASAPNAIPNELMRTLWRIILTNRLKTSFTRFDLYDWLRRLKHGGLSPSLRLELHELLMPRITIRKAFSLDDGHDEVAEPKRINDLVEWEIALSTDHPHHILREVAEKNYWQSALPDLLQDFNFLLRNILDLMNEFGGADDKSDHSYIHQPSISNHPQNKDFRDWTVLIDLVRDAWISTKQSKPDLARVVAEEWWMVPYPLFKRLAFFAAAQGDVISTQQSLNWLLSNNSWWLWSIETEREAIRLLVSIAPSLDSKGRAELEQSILQGPPREMFKDDIDQNRWTSIVDREVWLRLAKIKSSGVKLGLVAKTRYKELTLQYPQWTIAQDEKDEFPYWMSDGAEWRKFISTPYRRRELMEWLKKQVVADHWQEDDWRQRCRDNFPTTSCALFALTQELEWPVSPWREALQAWSEDKCLKRSWRYMAKTVANAPNELLRELSHSIAWWLQAQAKTFVGQEELFHRLVQRILELEEEESVQSDEDPVSRAINHPVGLVTEALLHWWYRQEPVDRQGLAFEIKPVFTRLCNTHIQKFRHARLLLATHVIPIFRVDPDWAKEYLLPLFDWQQSESEAKSAWEGFLWSPRRYKPLMTAIKQQLLGTVMHYSKLGKHAEQYAAFLTFAALEPGDTFTQAELAHATRALPVEGLHSAAQALVRALEGAGEQRREYWHNRVSPYLKFIWPKTRNIISPAISESLSRLCIAAQSAFPESLNELKHWLQPPEYPEFIVHLLSNAKLPKEFPEESLMFLDIIINDATRWSPSELPACLDMIQNSKPDLVNDIRYKRLREYLRRHGNV